MKDNYKVVSINSSSINNPSMISKYASLGYFSYKYVNSLPRNGNVRSLVRLNTNNRGARHALSYNGSYLQVCMVNFKAKRKIDCIVYVSHGALSLSVGELVDLCKQLYYEMVDDENNCYVKFDCYTISNK